MRQLRAAIDEDLRLLSHYVTHIRTTASQYYGVEVAPLAAKHKLRVHLALALSPEFFVDAETDAAVRAVQQHPQSIEAITIGEPSDDPNKMAPALICEKIDEVQRRLGQELTQGVRFGTYLTGFAELQCTPMRSVADAVDFFAVQFAPKLSSWNVSRMTQAWEDALNPRRHHKRHVLTLAFVALPHVNIPRRKVADMMIDYLKYMRTWTLPGGGDNDVVVFVADAFDTRQLLVPNSPYERSYNFQRIGLFTFDRRRKLLGLPPPLRADHDPIQLPEEPATPSCPAGMYQMIIKRLSSAVVACHITGYNFHSPTLFNERLLEATCGNPFCQVVISALRAIPRPLPCPFDDQVTEETLREVILKPVKEYCPFMRAPTSDTAEVALVERSIVVSPLHVVRDVCLHFDGWFMFIVRDGNHPERCQARTGFDGRPLNQTVLEKMCAEPSCELMMQQLANPFRVERCKGRGVTSLETDIVRPYFDGCYEESLMAASYFDVVYRPRKIPPRLPSSVSRIEPTRRPDTSQFDRGSHLDEDPHTDESRPDSSSAATALRKASGKDRQIRHGNVDSLSSSGSANEVTKPLTELPARQHIKQRPVNSATPEPPETSAAQTLNPSPSLKKQSKSNGKVAAASVSMFLLFLLLAVLCRRVLKQYLPAHNANYQSLTHNTISAPLESKQHQGFWSDGTLMSLFVQPSQLYDVRMIGSGGQALVYLVLYRPDSSTRFDTSQDIAANIEAGAVCIAAKRLTRATINANPDAVNKFVAEIKLVASLRHPNIVSLVGVSWTTGTDIQALFELMPDGDLCAYLSSTPRYEWTATKFRLVLDVIEALAYAHSRSPVVVHRDIKSRNVLLTPFFPVTADATTVTDAHNPTVDRRLGAKLTDFGVSRQLSKHATMTTGVGTSRWLAPEVILGGGDYDESSDVYSFGVLLSELDTHALPFVERRTPTGDLLPDIALLQMVAMEGVTPAFMGSSPVALVALAHECLAYDPTKRPTANQVVRRLQELLRGTGERTRILISNGIEVPSRRQQNRSGC